MWTQVMMYVIFYLNALFNDYNSCTAYFLLYISNLF